MAAIAALADKKTGTIDYSKNDVFAVGLIAYKLCCGNADAEPWGTTSSHTHTHTHTQLATSKWPTPGGPELA